ncbi:MAG TPA: PIN domain-containing protein [Candidatus Limnocylindria bacterium]|nr:PIN domain-containing protein [Candidatus Limnocylindria bacterium]
MRRVFADTSYWIALVNPRDQIHAKAVSVTQQISPVRILTSEMVLAEVLNSFSDGGPLRHAVGGMVQKLSSNWDVVIVPQTSEQFETALRRYKRAADKSWSLTDCASFQVMETEQIQAALTHDQHFAQAGFEPLLR